MGDVVRYLGIGLIGFVMIVADYLTFGQMLAITLVGVGLFVCSFVEWKKLITYKVEQIIDKAVEKAKERMKPVELDDWYLPLDDEIETAEVIDFEELMKAKKVRCRKYFYDLKEMRG